MLKAGFARVDITPPLGTPLTGYFEERISDGILDPIELNAVAITQGEDTAVIIAGDILDIHEKDAASLRSLIEKECGIPADHMILQAIHQHTSTTPFAPGVTDHLYDEWLKRKYCDVVKMALDDRREAKLSIAAGETDEPVSFVRRYRMKDGSCCTNPGRLNPDIDHPMGKADNTVRLVKFEREGANDIALVGFATHPDIIGGNKFSADWPGWVRRMTEQDLTGVSCILVNGCQGDTNHIDVTKPHLGTGKDKRVKYYEYSRKMGRIIANKVVDLWGQTEACAAGPLTTKVEIKLLRTNTEGIERLEECKAISEKVFAGGEWPDEVKTMADKADIHRVANLEKLPVFQKIPVSMVALGNIVLIGYGGEAFTRYADVLRETFPQLFILTACNANGVQGYFPSTEAFEEGGYEAHVCMYFPEVAPILQNTALDLIREHLEK